MKKKSIIKVLEIENEQDKLDNNTVSLELYVIILKTRLESLLAKAGISVADLFDKFNLSLLVQEFNWSKNSALTVKALIEEIEVVA